MRTRIVIVVVALALGGVAAVLAARYLDSAAARIEAETEPIAVLVAAEDLPRGLSAEELIERELLIEQEIPAQFVSSDAVSSERAIEGQVLALPMAAGEQITASRFQYPSRAGLSYTVPEGYVAVTIPSDEVKGVAGFIKPGDFVTVFVTINDPEAEDDNAQGASAGGGSDMITRIALASVRVLAVETRVTRDPESTQTEDRDGAVLATSRSEPDEESQTASSVTLALTPQDAETIVFAEEEGSVWLGLVGENTEIPGTDGVTLATLFE